MQKRHVFILNKMFSLNDVDILVNDYLIKNYNFIYSQWVKKNTPSELGFSSFIEEITPKLKNSYITFINSNLDFSILNSYLWPTVSSAINNQLDIKKIKVFICPGCKFNNKHQPLLSKSILECNVCSALSKTEKSLPLIKFYETFSIHNKNGYKCLDCSRFIPHPLDSNQNIMCPYLDCHYVGKISNLLKMNHPSVMEKVKISSLDANINETNLSNKNLIKSQDVSSDNSIELQQSFNEHLLLIEDTINSQINVLCYNSNSSTYMHKMCMYEAFKKVMEKNPEDMVSYLVYLNANVGLQNEIFKEYVSILEKNLPFVFIKNKKKVKINGLLDEELCIFDGISSFETIINKDGIIKNNTQEFYIGGRAASYARPYWIGKILDIKDVDSDTSILHNMKDYSFTKIWMNNCEPDTKVKITHLRVPPHYQMGALTYLNRIRRKLVDKIYLILNGKKRETSR